MLGKLLMLFRAAGFDGGTGFALEWVVVSSRVHRSLVFFAAILLSAACTKTYVIEPVTGRTASTASRSGFVLSANADAWGGEPYDLDEYLTPIRVEIVNGSSEDVRVDFADFALIDDRGFRYAAINPFTGEPERSSLPSDGSRDAFARYTSEAKAGSALDDAADPPAPDRRLARQAPPHPAPHFYAYPHHHRHYYHYQPWPYVYYWPPDYGVHAYYWDDRYYRSTPSNDVLRLSLPQGVLKSTGRVSGFVYFQNAATRAGRLSLIWTVRSPSGADVDSLAVSFVVVED